MNWLVYKDENKTETVRVNSKGQIVSSDPKVSEILFKRLKVQEEERYDDFSQRNLLAEIDGNDPSQRRSKTSLGSRASQAGKRLSYAEWLKGKDAENRLRRKLTMQAQNEVKETLLEVAKNERRKYESRVKKMDAWLMQNKLDEASRLNQMAQIDQREETNRILREEEGAHAETYKEWMKVQSSKKK